MAKGDKHLEGLRPRVTRTGAGTAQRKQKEEKTVCCKE